MLAWVREWFRGNAGIGGWWTAERQQHAVDVLVKGGVSELGAKALVARWSGVSQTFNARKKSSPNKA
ncbi:hypothetical protein M446_7002 (plasmid) [Methylobacterium sp. 4-46]|uniref:hypothetical protein n=1 Tax=unclassified Methylobacterium TaxID=2615210 RepID=UPI000152D856|nr:MULTISPECIES: hypothetical protein [Methylobacterium]ACA21228.1 hypothetical protein M446_7002 [Methylobacterium sp. 4-46]WFT83792.1 hypothetical protein QA634_35245 [Methylobacterium nodulans]